MTPTIRGHHLAMAAKYPRRDRYRIPATRTHPTITGPTRVDTQLKRPPRPARTLSLRSVRPAGEKSRRRHPPHPAAPGSPIGSSVTTTLDSAPVLDIPFETAAYQTTLYDRYAAMRETGAVVVTPQGGTYLTRFADCQRLLQDTAFVRRPPGTASAFSTDDRPANSFERMLDDWLVYQDPPRHNHFLRQVAPSFSPRLIRALEPRIRELAATLCAGLPSGQAIDFVGSFAYRLPVTVICDLLSVPVEMTADFQSWSRAITTAINTGVATDTDQATGAVEALQGYFTAHIAQAPDHDPNTPLGGLMAALASGALKRDEVVNFCISLLWAGHETTKNLLANGLLLLIRHPEAAALLRGNRNPALLNSAIEEMLRYDSPIQKISRWTSTDVELGACIIPTGTLVTALLGSANHDPQVFPAAESFLVDRAANAHLAFGRGIHHCLGAGLARLEARIAFETMLDNFTDIELVHHEWLPLSAFRGLKNLSVCLRT